MLILSQLGPLIIWPLGIAVLPGPTNTVLPAITGTLKVGQVLNLSTGTWTGNGTITYARQWTRDGVAIAGATGATYTLVAADDLTTIGATVTATDLDGSRARSATGGGAVTRVAPTAAGAIADQSYSEDDAITALNVAADFTGAGITYALATSSAALPAGLTLSGAGVITGTPTTPASAAIIVVRGTNSGGSADTAFDITVTADAGGTGVYLLSTIGQSNARAATTSAQNCPAKYLGTMTNVFILFPGTGANRLAEIAAATFVPYIPGADGSYTVGVDGTSDPYNTGDSWGSELEFAWQLRNAGDTRKIYIIKEAQNGQKIATDWNPATSNDNFAYLEAQTTRARALIAAASETITDEIAMWNQGEADANTDVDTNAYNTNFTAFMSAFRSRVSATALFIGERIRPLGYTVGDGTGDGSGWPRAWTVREAMLAVLATDTRAKAIDLDFDPSNFAQIHPFTPAGFAWVEGKGLRCYASWAGTHDATYGSLYDAVPAAFSFADTTGQPVSTVVTSNAILLTGYQRRCAVTVTGGEWRSLNSLNSDAVVQDWTTSAGVIDPFQKLQLRRTSSASNSTATDVTVTVGGVGDTWTVTTAAAGGSMEAETTAFLAKATGLGAASFSSPQQTALNDFYIALKAAGLLSGKVLRLFTSNMPDSIAATIDLVDQNRVLTAAGSAPTWAKEGWTTADVTGRGYIMGNPQTMNTGGTALSLNNSGLFAYIHLLLTDTQQDLNGDNNGFGLRINATVTRSQMHSVTNSQLTGRTNTAGFYAAYRSTSVLTTLYGIDGASQGTSSTASVSVATTAVAIGAATGAQQTSNGQVRFAGVLGDGVTAGDILALRNAIVAYITAFG
jgi:hypothetical protein